MRRTVSDLALKEVAPLREAYTPVFETAQHRDERTKAASLTAAELMTAPAVTVGPEELVAAAARRMYDRNVNRLPVVDRSGALERLSGAVDGVVAVKSELRWQAEDTGTQVPRRSRRR
jgi:CBS domain-containing protein